jgi:hypothetical protein
MQGSPEHHAPGGMKNLQNNAKGMRGNTMNPGGVMPGSTAAPLAVWVHAAVLVRVWVRTAARQALEVRASITRFA